MLNRLILHEKTNAYNCIFHKFFGKELNKFNVLNVKIVQFAVLQPPRRGTYYYYFHPNADKIVQSSTSDLLHSPTIIVLSASVKLLLPVTSYSIGTCFKIILILLFQLHDYAHLGREPVPKFLIFHIQSSIIYYLRIFASDWRFHQIRPLFTTSPLQHLYI